MENKYITIKQAAKILGVSALTLRNWDNSGKFPAGRHPISNYRVYKVADVEKILSDIEISRNSPRPSKNTVKNEKTDAKKLMVRHLP